MSKEKTLEDLLEEYASKGISKSEPPKKKSFLDGAKKSIQEHREVKAAAHKAEQERIAKERREAAARAERERPVQISLSESYLKEINIVKIIKENNHPIEIVIDIGSTVDKEDEPLNGRQRLRELYAPIDDFLTKFDKTYGTYHRKEEKTEIFYTKHLTHIGKKIRNEKIEWKAILSISLQKRQTILEGFTSTKIGKLCTEIKKSELYKEITKQIDNNIHSCLKKSYDNNQVYASIHFYISERTISGDLVSINYFDLGFGKMSDDAIYAIAFLIYEYTYKCCESSELCKKISCNNINLNSYDGKDITLYFVSEFPHNPKLKSW